MAKTYAAELSGYFINEYFKKRLDAGNILVTTKHGGWAILSDAEFNLFRTGHAEEDPNLQNLLIQQGILITETNAPAIVGCYKKKYAHMFEGTTLHILTPTLRCNQKCVYCYASSKPEFSQGYDMTKKTVKAVVEFIFQCPSRDITIEFQGGEPLLNFQAVKNSVRFAKKKAEKVNKRVKFTLVTNLTTIDEKKIAFLKKERIIISSSLDGPKWVHDKNRRYDAGGGTYDDVIAGIDQLRAHNIPINLMPTITRNSLPHWKEIIDEYVRLGMSCFWARKLAVSGSALNAWDRIGYSPEEFINFWKKSLEYIFKLNREGTYFEEGYAAILLKNILFSKNYNRFVCMASPCGCAWGQAAYDYRGDIYTCDEARSFDVFHIGNVHSNRYSELYSSSKVIDTIRLSTGEPLNCATCVYHAFCGPCIVENYAERGNPLRNDGNSCNIKKSALDYVFNSVLQNKEKREIAFKWANLKKPYATNV